VILEVQWEPSRLNRRLIKCHVPFDVKSSNVWSRDPPATQEVETSIGFMTALDALHQGIVSYLDLAACPARHCPKPRKSLYHACMHEPDSVLRGKESNKSKSSRIAVNDRQQTAFAHRARTPMSEEARFDESRPPCSPTRRASGDIRPFLRRQGRPDATGRTNRTSPPA